MTSPSHEPPDRDGTRAAWEPPGPSASAVDGPPASFEQIYEEYFEFVWRSARRLGVQAGAVEDAVQEVFVVVHRKLGSFEGRSAFRTWLYGIILRVARQHHRRRLRSAPVEADEPEERPDETGLPDERAAQAEAVRILESVLDEMPAERREVFVMVELEQMPIPEIAELVGEKVNTLYSRLRLAREDFKRSVVRRGAKDAWRVR